MAIKVQPANTIALSALVISTICHVKPVQAGNSAKKKPCVYCIKDHDCFEKLKEADKIEKDYKKKLRLLVEAKSHCPNDKTLFYNQAGVLTKLGECDRAEGKINYVLKDFPKADPMFKKDVEALRQQIRECKEQTLASPGSLSSVATEPGSSDVGATAAAAPPTPPVGAPAGQPADATLSQSGAQSASLPLDPPATPAPFFAPAPFSAPAPVRPTSPAAPSAPLYQKWWFWTAVGAAAAGFAVAAGLAAYSNPPGDYR